MEAVSVGYGCALERDDIATPYFRDLGHFSPVEFLQNASWRSISARKRGYRRQGRKYHVGDLNFGVFSFPSHLADNYPVGAGAALAFKMRGEKRIAVACTGTAAPAAAIFTRG